MTLKVAEICLFSRHHSGLSAAGLSGFLLEALNKSILDFPACSRQVPVPRETLI